MNVNVFWIFFLSFCVVSAADVRAEKRALVTGGAGFLGSHMCEKLLKEGYEVICLDNLSSGSRGNIESYLNNSHFYFVEHDVETFFDPEIPIDVIYNFACPASPVYYQKDPLKTLRTNVLGALNMLELCKKYDAVIFQASTSEIYGDPLEHPQKETYWGNVNPIGTRSCYDEGKRCAETLFFDYHRAYGLKIKLGRIFNTYGPRMALDDGRVVSNFIVQALNDTPITLYGDGLQTRSFCYVDDLIRGIYAFTQTDSSVTGPINLGNPGEYTMVELAEKIINLLHSKSILSYKSLPADDPKRRKPDITCAESLLRWSPEINLDVGLEKTCYYFKEKIGQ